MIRTPIEIRRDESGEIHIFIRGVEQLLEIKTGRRGEYLFLNDKPVGPVVKPTEPD